MAFGTMSKIQYHQSDIYSRSDFVKSFGLISDYINNITLLST
ncbi:hypothetical protein AO385_0859 [Moraxella catarrhalis]|uniref:Uncharacterized protein n=1 Tax=Moraxella catarrhalis TaxID=480 RepID=A0A198UDY3_MORCA|nr:hypothetical protein AO384_1983 [Moraxella catarrhalis]OAU98701.1 hypothetical protein AO383_0490 [Moraxella catarrhalis]OAV02741.1 hypothetical protein AO385_0859 [Moraxella catarrhalis]